MKYIPLIVTLAIIYVVIAAYFNEKENREEHKRNSS